MIVEFGQGKYYLYRHIRLDNKQIFYIGIGTVGSEKFLKKNGYSFKARYYRAYMKNKRNPHWTNIANKAGYDVEIILESNNNDFIETKEIEFIALYGRLDLGTGILTNMTEGGRAGYTQSPESIIKRSKSLIGKSYLTEDGRKRLSEAGKKLKGIKRSKEFCEKLSIAHSGKIVPEEIREKHRNKGRPIYQYDKEGNFIKEWKNIHLIESETSFKRGSIYNCCFNLCYKNKGFIWRFEKYDKIPEDKMPSLRKEKMLQYDLEGNFIREWESLSAACKEIGSHPANLRRAIKTENKRNKSYRGYIWKYKSDVTQ